MEYLVRVTKNTFVLCAQMLLASHDTNALIRCSNVRTFLQFLLFSAAIFVYKVISRDKTISRETKNGNTSGEGASQSR